MVYILLADGFEEMEALCPYDILCRGGVDVRFVSIMPTLTVKGAHGVLFTADIMFKDVSYEDVKMTVLPGGMPGMTNLNAYKPLDRLLSVSERLAAICAAPSVLGLRGYLQGKRAVCYPGFEDNLKGAVLSEKRVVTDGKVTTAVGAGAAVEFGLELLALLKDRNTSEKIRLSMK